MTIIKQGLAWWAFVPQHFSPVDFIRLAAETGYHGLELVEETYWQTVKDAGLEIATHRAHDSISQGLNRRENRASLRQKVRCDCR